MTSGFLRRAVVPWQNRHFMRISIGSSNVELIVLSLPNSMENILAVHRHSDTGCWAACPVGRLPFLLDNTLDGIEEF